jgi:hypothetical protein
MTDERSQFEAWWQQKFNEPCEGGYEGWLAFEVWQAARAAPAQPFPPERVANVVAATKDLLIATSFLGLLDALARRFSGIDLQYRRVGWPRPWRAQMIAAKNERAEYRVAEYADTAELAIRGLADKVR